MPCIALVPNDTSEYGVPRVFDEVMIMTDEEKYLFDLQGYLIVEGALGAHELVALNDLVDQKIGELDESDFQCYRFADVLGWQGPMLDLLDHALIAPRLRALIGGEFRLDHVYLDVMRKGLSPIGAGLHGGGTPHNPSMFYHVQDGRMYNGLTVVAYNLHDVNPGDGGFGCVPGSHKANFPYPSEWKDMTESRADCVRAVTGRAGTAVIFTEALTHGALPWSSDAERRTLFFKFNHPAMSWSNRYHDSSGYSGLTAEQIRILAPPQDPHLMTVYGDKAKH
jgi:hypothetical protein